MIILLVCLFGKAVLVAFGKYFTVCRGRSISTRGQLTSFAPFNVNDACIMVPAPQHVTPHGSLDVSIGGPLAASVYNALMVAGMTANWQT